MLKLSRSQSERENIISTNDERVYIGDMNESNAMNGTR